MAKRNRRKGQTMICRKIHRKVKFEQYVCQGYISLRSFSLVFLTVTTVLYFYFFHYHFICLYSVTLYEWKWNYARSDIFSLNVCRTKILNTVPLQNACNRSLSHRHLSFNAHSNWIVVVWRQMSNNLAISWREQVTEDEIITISALY